MLLLIVRLKQKVWAVFNIWIRGPKSTFNCLLSMFMFKAIIQIFNQLVSMDTEKIKINDNANPFLKVFAAITFPYTSSEKNTSVRS